MIDKSKLRKYSASEIENSFELSTVEDFVKLSDVESLLATTTSTEPASRGRIASDNGASPAADVGGLTEAALTEAVREWFPDRNYQAPFFARAFFATSPAPSAKQEPSDKVASEKEALRRLSVQGMADCMDMVRQDLIDMGIIDKSVAPMFIPEAIANYVKRLAAPSASASPAAPQEPMREVFANLLRVQRAEAETGDPYIVGLYNGMAMMCANIDCDINWKPMEYVPRAAPVAGSQQVPVSRADLEAIDAAMQHMGDALNDMDAVEAEDEEVAKAGFEAIARLLAAAPAVPVPVEPTYWNSQRKMIERAIIGLRDGWATRKDADDALAALGAAPSLQQPKEGAGDE